MAKEVNINFENLSTSEKRVQGPHPAAPLPDDDHSTHTTDDDVVSLANIDHQAQQVSPSLCTEQLRLIELVLSGVNVFYTGGAGTGKSTVLRALVKELQRQGRHVQVVTPTGISALNVGGSTYFTWAGWNPGVMKKPIKEIGTLAMSKERRLRIQETDVLIIDEISMLESNQLRRLDRACRAARSCDAAFGGIQVVVTGDFYQLPRFLPNLLRLRRGIEDPGGVPQLRTMRP